MKKSDMILFNSQDKAITLNVIVEQDTVWLTQAQMVQLFGRDQSVISRHINTAFKEEIDKESNKHFLHIANSDRPVAFYSLDVIISVGYRIKSLRGVEFRRWANKILKEYIVSGFVVNEIRLRQLNSAVRLMRRVESDLDAKQVLDVIARYNSALDLLDAYDHQSMIRPKGSESIYILSYDECRRLIDSMKFSGQSELFGTEKDDSFKGSIGNIYRGFWHMCESPIASL